MDAFPFMPMKFIYAHPPAWILTVPWEHQAFALAAEQARQVAEREGLTMASAWAPPMQIRFRPFETPLLSRPIHRYWKCETWQEELERRGIRA